MAQIAKRIDAVFPDGKRYSHPKGPFLLNYNVLFYKDGSGVNLNYGDARGQPPITHLGPHKVEFYDAADVLIETIDVPNHWWNAEWNWPLSYPKIVTTPAQMMAKRWSFFYGKNKFNIGAGSMPPHAPYKKPMDMSAVITLYQPTTGERPDIGDDTDWTAAWLLGGSPDPMLAAAKSNSTVPYHCRDSKTRKPVNLLNEVWNMYDLPGYMAGTYVWKGPPQDPVNQPRGYQAFGGNIQPQQGHNPDLSTEAALATKSIQFLRDLQYNATFMVITDGTNVKPGKPIVSGELRGLAWAFARLAGVWLVTKEFEADGYVMDDYDLHDSTYWKQVLDVNRDYYRTFTKDPGNVFHTIPSMGFFGPWQMDYMTDTLLYMVLIGLTDWLDIAIFASGNQVARAGGADFPFGYGVPYYVSTYRGTWTGGWPDDATQIARGQNPPLSKPADYGTPLKNWTELVDDMQKYGAAFGFPSGMSDATYAALKADPTHGYKPIVGGEYSMNWHASLAEMLQLDQHPDPLVKGKFTQAFPNLQTYFNNVDRMLRGGATTGGGINLRAAIMPTCTYDPVDFAAPVVVTPGPVTNPDPTSPPVPTPIPKPSYPPPNLDPLSYTFEAKALVTAVTDLPNVYVECAGKVPSLFRGGLIANVKGNKYTNVFMNLPGPYGDFFHQYANTPAGAKVWVEDHGTGNYVRFVDCGGININGVQLTPLVTAPIVTPPVVIPPVEPPKQVTLKRVSYSSINSDVLTRANKGELIVITQLTKDKVLMGPLSGIPAGSK